MAEENNDNLDLHLKKFFEEEDHFKLSPPQTSMNPGSNPHLRKYSNINKSRKINNKNIQPSFFENLEFSIQENIENSVLGNYAEFTRHIDFLANMENYFFLEKQENNDYSFNKYFFNHYARLIERLKNNYDNKKLDLKLLLQIMSSFSIDLISDLIKFIKLCDKSFCFDALKSKNQQNRTQNLPKQFSNNPIKQETSFSLAPSIFENESLFSVESKKGRKGWSNNETQALEKIISNYFPHQIPPEIIEDFSKKTSRSLFSIQAKIQKMKKKLQNQTRLQFIKDEEIKMDIIDNNAFATENFDIVEENDQANEFFQSRDHSNVFGSSPILANMNKKNNLNSNLNKMPNKYDMPLENIIKIALREFPRHAASKNEILLKMEELFFRKNSKVDSKWKMSTSQLLASSKNFIKIKGTYGLNEKNITKETWNLINNPRNELSIKNKLILILNKINNKKANINEITDFYIKYFKENDLTTDIKKTKASLQKVLKQHSEFDTSQIKTYYMLNNDN